MIRTLPLLGILCAALSSPVWTCAQSRSGQIDYIILEGGGPDQGPGPDMNKNIAELKEKLGPVDPNTTRMYGYGVQQIRILSRSAAFVAAEIEQALDAAEKNDVPVWLHIDPYYAWGADTETRPEDAPRIKFWEDPQMREWGEFPVDHHLPDYSPRLWFNWGPWCSLPAVPALGSDRLVKFACEQLDIGVLKPLTKRLRVWKREGREYLFAGINIGWEIHFPIYKERGSGAPIVAEHPKNARGLEMDERVRGGMQLGYASLYWMGWNEARLRREALRSGMTRDEKFNEVCYAAIHKYMAALAKECFDKGISRDKIYTHIVALATVNEPDTFMPPIWTAVNRWSTPGFTMDNKGAARYDLKQLQADIEEADSSLDGGFGVVETYFNLNGRDYVTDAATYVKELDELFDAGASVYVVYAAFPFKDGRAPDVAFDAVTTWLKGE